MSTNKPPQQKPGKSRQDYQTPVELLSAVQERFGALSWDCAASASNSVTGKGSHYSLRGKSAFNANPAKQFGPHDLLWCNPPFGEIARQWAPLIASWHAAAPHLKVLLLTPASVGSEWFRRHINGSATVLALNPRVTFLGETSPFPKDLMLSCFGFGAPGFSVWKWKDTKRASADKSSAQAAANDFEARVA